MAITLCTLAELLTTEILVEILIRVPLDSVLACRRVCRSWYKLIGEPFFADLHRSFSATPLTITWFHSSPKVKLTATFGSVTVADQEVNNSSFRYNLNLTARKVIPDLNTRLGIVGSCNGLLCLCSFDGNLFKIRDGGLFLCNPVLGSSLKLPDPPADNLGFVPPQIQADNLGFGYIPSTRQYKVVKYVYFDKERRHVFHVCTIQSGGGSSKAEKKIISRPIPSATAWRTATVCDASSSQPKGDFSHATFFKGSIIWIAETPKVGEDLSLIYFDIEKEVMRALQLPSIIFYDYEMTYIFDESIHIGVYYDEDGNDHLYICEEHYNFANVYVNVMEDYKNVNTLKPKWSVRLPAKCRLPLKLFKVHNNERLLIGIRNSELAYCDPTEQALEMIKILHFPVNELAIDVPNLLGCLL